MLLTAGAALPQLHIGQSRSSYTVRKKLPGFVSELPAPKRGAGSFKGDYTECHANRFMRGGWHTNVAIRHLLAELLIWACLGKWAAPTWRRHPEAYADMGGRHRPYAQSMFGATLVSAVSWVNSE